MTILITGWTLIYITATPRKYEDHALTGYDTVASHKCKCNSGLINIIHSCYILTVIVHPDAGTDNSFMRTSDLLSQLYPIPVGNGTAITDIRHDVWGKKLSKSKGIKNY